MHVISRKLLTEFSKVHSDVEEALNAWFAEADKAKWKTPDDIKQRYRSADFLSENRIVFNIKGNKYRLIVSINYNKGIVYIRFIGTHAEYNKIDAERI